MHDPGLARQFLESIPKAMEAIRSEMRFAAKAELTIPQFRILASLSIRPMTHSELAQRLGVSAPGISRMITGLMKKALILQVRSEKDRRVVYAELTHKGRVRFNALKKKAQDRLQARFEELSEESQKHLCEGLRLLDHLVNPWNGNDP